MFTTHTDLAANIVVLTIHVSRGACTWILKRLHHQKALHPSQKHQIVPPALQASTAARLQCPSDPEGRAEVHRALALEAWPPP